MDLNQNVGLNVPVVKQSKIFKYYTYFLSNFYLNQTLNYN